MTMGRPQKWIAIGQGREDLRTQQGHVAGAHGDDQVSAAGHGAEVFDHSLEGGEEGGVGLVFFPVRNTSSREYRISW